MTNDDKLELMRAALLRIAMAPYDYGHEFENCKKHAEQALRECGVWAAQGRADRREGAETG